MADRQTPIHAVRERLTGLLADWGTEMSALLKELEDKRDALAALEDGSAARDQRVRELEKRVADQDKLVETLRADAEEAGRLRSDVHAKDLEIERLRSELESKKELVRALRRDAEAVDRLKAELKLKDREIESLKAAAVKADLKAEQLEQELSAARDADAARAHDESSEVEALRAELEARKTLIKSLRTDQDRVAALQASLDEKREVIAQLEATITHHSATIAELKRSVDLWKRKYQTLKGGDSSATSAQIPAFTETDVRTMARLEREAGVKGDATIAIDMRRSLLEARRAASQGQNDN